MAPRFGTSGLRGLVTELTDALVADYVTAFASACAMGRGVCVGWDLRPSSPSIAKAVSDALIEAGLTTYIAGALPTPALALGAAQRGLAAVMVTGSHIPADRNGLKFFTSDGEISKADEAAIEAARGAAPGNCSGKTEPLDLTVAYRQRYAKAFGVDALSGLRIGIYQHSSVARDLMVQVVQDLGATPVPLGRSDVFVPVDTEAVDPETRLQLAEWCRDNGLDALVSTDGDADRPMVADATGSLVPGDILGPLTARFLGADTIVTPISSNTAVDLMEFGRVVRTRIGSPYVIAGMEAHAGKTVGYEANGGFLLGFDATGPAGTLAPLMTRDCLLPILAPIAIAHGRGMSLSDLVAALPQRFTAADRLQGVLPAAAQAFLRDLRSDPSQRAAFFARVPSETGPVLGAEVALDDTDGLRVSFAEAIVHLRLSGNAPEFRCYAEARDKATADALVARTLAEVAALLRLA